MATTTFWYPKTLSSASLGELSHHLSAFARTEGCESYILGRMRSPIIAGWTPFPLFPLAEFEFDQDETPIRQQAIGFLRRTRTTWSLVHAAIVDTCCAQLACNPAICIARAQTPYLIRLVQAQYQHLALGAQLIAAARHESSLLGAAGPSFVQSLRRMRRTLIAFIQNVRPRIDSDAASRDFGIVPVAPLIAAYIAHTWGSRGAPLGAPPPEHTNAAAITAQLRAFLELAPAPATPTLPPAVAVRYTNLYRTLSLYGVPLGVSAPVIPVAGGDTPSQRRPAANDEAWARFADRYTTTTASVALMAPESMLGAALTLLAHAVRSHDIAYPRALLAIGPCPAHRVPLGVAALLQALRRPDAPEILSHTLALWATVQRARRRWYFGSSPLSAI